MPFCFSYSSPMNKYSFIEQQKRHENEYKKFLNTLPIIHQYSTSNKIRSTNFNILQRQNQLEYRQMKRKHEYQRIEKENIRFSQRLINAKSYFSRLEQQTFFDRHCKLKQRLQHYPDLMKNQSNKHERIVEKQLIDSSFLIYNNHRIVDKSHQSQDTMKINFIKHNSKKRSLNTSNIENFNLSSFNSNTKENHSEIKSSSNIIHWNSLKNSEQSSSLIQPILSSSVLSI